MHEILNLSASISAANHSRSFGHRSNSTGQSVSEESWGTVRYASVLPTPGAGRRDGEGDEFLDRRPLIGVVYVLF